MIYLAKGVARWSRALKHENARRLVKLQNSTRWKDEWEFFCGFCERYWDECEGEKLWLIRKSVWAINICESCNKQLQLLKNPQEGGWLDIDKKSFSQKIQEIKKKFGI